jgi:UDP-glucose 4-epimerase
MADQKLILVTGGAGFVGSHLCERLVKDGHRVISLDNYFTGSKDNHVPGAEYREGHTKDIEKLVPETPDLIYHLGEYSRVEQSLEEPALVWDLNVAGTQGVLEFWRTRKCKLVYAGSSTKFGDGGLARIATPYAWTKAANTELVKNYSAWYGLPYAITYFYNVYGPGERAGRYGTVVEIFRQKYKNGEPLTVEEPGTQERNFTHIDDIISGVVLVGEKGEGDEYGLGSPESFTILELAKLFGGEIKMIPSRPGNRTNSALDLTKAHGLGWKPQRRLEEYIRTSLAL